MPTDFSSYLPNVGGINWIMIISFLIGFFIVAVLVGVLTWLLLIRAKYKYKIVIYEKVNGRFIPARRDMAMEYKVGQGGDIVFYLRKHKKYLARPELQTGVKTYWFWIREDGEWINFTMADLDNQAREMKANFLDKEMRYNRTALQRNMRERFDKPSFLQMYGGLIAYITLIAVTGIMFWLLVDKLIDVTASVSTLMDVVREVMELSRDTLGSVSNIKQGSGYVAA